MNEKAVGDWMAEGGKRRASGWVRCPAGERRSRRRKRICTGTGQGLAGMSHSLRRAFLRLRDGCGRDQLGESDARIQMRLCPRSVLRQRALRLPRQGGRLVDDWCWSRCGYL